MEPSSKFRNITYQSNNSSLQASSKISDLASNANADSTITSNSSTTVVMEKDLNEDIINTNEIISEDKSSDKIDKDITIKPRYLNFEADPQHSSLLGSQKQRDADSDNDISPVFESPNTLKRNLLNHDKVRQYINENNNINSSNTFNGNNVTTRYKQKRSFGQLRKQLGTPVPLPYLDKNGSNTTNTVIRSLETISNARPSVKYVAPIRRQTILHEKSTNSSDGTSPPKLLTMDILEEKRQIVTNRWRDLLLKDKIKVEDKLKQLKLQEKENINKNESVQSTRKLQHLTSVNKDATPLNLNDSFNTLSTIEAEVIKEEKKDDHGELYNWKNGSDFNEISILKLQEEIRKNAYKLDLIISMLKGRKERDVTSIKQARPKWYELITFRFSKYNIVWTVCIIIVFLCQLYVLKYL